ncbi:MAG: acyl-CoA dehydratase activase-related protein [Treponema sp.]
MFFHTVRMGIDVGSTTVKTVVLSANGSLVYSRYERHRADIRKTIITVVQEALNTIEKRYGSGVRLQVCVTGSGGLAVSKWLSVPFVQEVIAAAAAVQVQIPQTDVVIELGGEDAKITYFGTAVEQRMNGTCAGGTGAFIDQMAALLETDAQGLNELAKNAQTIYPIAARCGVFAKTDVQPLINEGARREDIAASIFQAVVNQTISGLACGKPIRGRCAFLGGPLHFLDQLRRRFAETLHLTEDEIIIPEYAQLFVAFGAALNAHSGTKNTPVLRSFVHPNTVPQRTVRRAAQYGTSGRIGVPILPSEHSAAVFRNTNIPLFFTHSGALRLETLRKRLAGLTNAEMQEVQRLSPLFENEAELHRFRSRHAREQAKTAPLAEAAGPVFLGLDAGSTTTKAVLIDHEGRILWKFYESNAGNPVQLAVSMLKELYRLMPEAVRIVRSLSTGYGEGLFQAAFGVDAGAVETIAHQRAAEFFLPGVEFLLDIGGQDMKCIRMKNGCITSIQLNEACSSGCGSFLDNFARSLGMPVQEFSAQGLLAAKPIDLGSRCTVFMNSRVKQAQKEGASVGDISAGLSYSVIKNALFKVIKLRNTAAIGKKVIVQGGTFHNDAVLRAFELITGREAVRPDISGLMGAFGAALLARDQWEEAGAAAETVSGLLSAEGLAAFQVSIDLCRCGKCPNNCRMTVNKFRRPSGTRVFITGNRCERGAELSQEPADTPARKKQALPNLFDWKYQRIFSYKPLDTAAASRGIIGIPRVLNIYENYPFWFTFFTALKFSVRLSPRSSRALYELGLESIPSESVCYPGKIAHGHIESLLKAGITAIFYPCIPYETQEDPSASNHFNCPVVTSYPEVLKNNIDALRQDENVRFISPFLPIYDDKRLAERLYEELNRFWSIPFAEIRAAVRTARKEAETVKRETQEQGKAALRTIREQKIQGVVLAGRPYHIDPEIHHGIPELLTGLGLAVLTEDSVAHLGKIPRPLRVVDQWVYHNRLYRAAEFTARQDDLSFIQLTSFGCGLDAVTADQVQEIIESRGKMYTLLKIDEGSNLGAVRIRVRSMLAAVQARGKKSPPKTAGYAGYRRVEFTEAMSKHYTILAPQMSPIHFDLLQAAFDCEGMRIEILPETDAAAVDCGLKYVNNDACYPAIIVAGQMIAALQSGKYDLDAVALIITQTGGGCRATNYIGFIRRALEDAGLNHIPVISLSMQMFEKNSGFKPTIKLVDRALKALCLGDLFMRVLYRTRPYEREAGAADALHRRYAEEIKSMMGSMTNRRYREVIRRIVRDFDSLPLKPQEKPRVGVVGEILVKFHPLANNTIVRTIEQEGAECVMPDLMDFLFYSLFDGIYRNTALEYSSIKRLKFRLLIWGFERYRRTIKKELHKSRRFTAPESIYRIAEGVKGILDWGNATGEGWFLTAEMVELIHSGVLSIACLQPFACLPNHVTGKGMIKELRRRYPQAQIAAIDFDPGASEVNQLNRLKLLLANTVCGTHPDNTKK